MPNRHLEQRRTRTKRIIATILATVYLCGSEGPMLLALAAPGWFVRPGAGVSSQPLGVSSFGAPGFGELSQAVNMANGNVFASAGGLSFNNQMQSGDENTNKIGGSNWNLTSRLRLNGFSKTSNANFGTDNLTLDQNIGSSYYGPHWTKPNVIPVNRLLSKDSPSGPASGCGNGSQSGGITNTGALQPGKYRLTLDARADANLQLFYGLDTGTATSVTTAAVTTSWQTFTRDFTVATGNVSSVAMAVWEASLTNPVWEVANLRSFRLDANNNPTGANLVSVADQDMRTAAWLGVCAKPSIESFSRLQKADYTGTPGTNFSGIVRNDTFISGTYKVSMQARTRNGSLAIQYGVNDAYLQAATLNTSWQSLSKTFTVTINQLDRVFEVIEGVANNPDWEVKNISVQRISPGSFTLSSGDGSSRMFKQVTPNFATTPSWITRYQTTTGTTFYALESQPGTQYVAEWIVLRQIGTNYVAHYYTAGGSRVTFSGDGEYADFMQNPYQQLRGASATTPDPEGIAAITPKTEISYTAANSGLISKIKDEWGRVTTHEWNTTDKTLTRINELLRDESNNATHARKTEFEYGVCFNGVCGNQRAVTKVTHTAPDGKGNMVSRSTGFDYHWRANNTRLMLAKVSRSVIGNQNQIHTVYTYEFDDRLTQVETVDNGGVAIEPAIKYIYAMGSTLYRRNNNLGEVTLKPTRTPNGLEYRVPAKFATDLYEARLEPKSDARLEWTRNGNKAAPVQLKRGKTATLGRFNIRPGDLLELRGSQGASIKLIPLMAGPGPLNTNVIVMQGAMNDPNRKQTMFSFDSSGQLTDKTVRDYNPWIPTASWFSHSLATKSLTTAYTYTATGSTSSIVSPSGRKDVYRYDAAGNVTKLETYKTSTDATPERSTTYTYDLDNRQTSEAVSATSGTRDGASYSYVENRKTTTYLQHTTSTGGQTFQTPSQQTDSRLIGGTLKRSYVEKYDPSGRLTQKVTSSSGLTGVTTDYLYHDGVGTWGPYQPSAEGYAVASALQFKLYADLPWQISNGIQRRNYYYDAFGNPNWERVSNSDGTAGALAYDQVSGSTIYSVTARFRSWNGFGQQVWDTLYENPGAGRPDKYIDRKVWNYYATGELDSSWEGQPSNTTDYGYFANGRVSGFSKGIGNGNGVTTPHEATTLDYDAFGRVITKTVDGFPTTFTYDTLDRTVNTVLPNGKGEAASYHSSGVQDFSCDFGGGGSGISPAAQPDQNLCSYNYTIDGLGRPAYNTTGTNLAGSRTTYYTYDPYDRPIRVYNDWLPMVAASTDRATYLVYDSEGNLTKQLGAVLGGNGYADPRRPYVEYEYDNFNRKLKERKLVRSGSSVTPSSIVMPGDSSIAQTTWVYDAWNRVTQSVDADGYHNNLYYDALGNMIQQNKHVCGTSEVECMANFSDEDASPSDGHATTKYAYDAARRLTATLDARGKTSRTRYNELGLPSSIMDARGITTKVMRYTADGLPKAVWEPDNDAGTTATYISADNGVDDPPNYVKIKRWQYGSSRKFPTSLDVANMNVTAEAGAVYTQYQYDFAGRPTLTTLPLGGTIEQGYDGRGNLTRLKDADGFVTEYKYDAWGQLLEEKKKRREGNNTDQNALPGDLISTYRYDQAGNLTQKFERGLYTDYWYNSLGKVQAESRPHSGTARFKYYTYRVDGVKTAETSYDYGGILSSQYNTVGCESNSPNVTSGNAQCWELSSLGRPSVTASLGISSAVQGGVYTRERIQWDAFNGLGLRYKRSFYGHGSIYAAHRTINGALNGDGQATLWRYDANGNLLKSYKRGVNGNGGAYTDGAVGDSSLASDVFTYSYSPTNKQIFRSSEVRTYNSNGTLVGRTAGASGGYTPTVGGPPSGVATTQSVTTISHTDRDTVTSASVTDTDASGTTASRSTTYAYYLDGSRSSTTVNGVGTQTFTYDARGRLQTNFDSTAAYRLDSGQQMNGVTTTYTYGANGEVTESLNDGLYSSKRTPTIGGLTYQTSGSAKGGYNGCVGPGACTLQQSTTIYNSDGRPQTTTSLERRRDWASSVELNVQRVSTNSYDTYGNLIKVEQSGYDESVRFPPNEGPVIDQRSTGTKTIYEAGYSVHNTPGWSRDDTYAWVQSGSTWYYQLQRSLTRSFTLGSRGQRLANTMTTGAWGEPFDGTTKRYDADDRGIEFKRAQSLGQQDETNYNLYWAADPARSEATDIALRYDPFGALALSVQSKFTRYTKPPQLNPDPGYTLLEWKSTSAVELDGSVLLLHSASAVNGVRDLSINNNVPIINTFESRDQDESFGLYDGVVNSDSKFNVIAPFNAIPRVDAGSIPLAAPITPLSSQVRVEPSAIVAPGNAPPSSDPGAITAPSSPAQPSTTAAPQTQEGTGFSSGTSLTNTTVSSQGVSAPSVGVQSFSVSNMTTTATSSSTAQPAPVKPISSQPAAFSSQINLEPPSSVLPPSITPLSASSIVAPSSFTPVLTASGDVSSIVAPGSSSVPTVGATPSSGTGTIVPPTSSVVPPGGSSGGIVAPVNTSTNDVTPLWIPPRIDDNRATLLAYSLENNLCGKKQVNELQQAAATGDEDKMLAVVDECVLRAYAQQHPDRLDPKVLDSFLRDIQNFDSDLRVLTTGNLIWLLDSNAPWANRQQAVLRDAREDVERLKAMTLAQRRKAISESTALNQDGIDFNYGYIRTQDRKNYLKEARFFTRALRANQWKDLNQSQIQKAFDCANPKGLNATASLNGTIQGGVISPSISHSVTLRVNFDFGSPLSPLSLGAIYSESTERDKSFTVGYALGGSASLSVGNYNQNIGTLGNTKNLEINSPRYGFSATQSDMGEASFGISTSLNPSYGAGINYSESNASC